MTNLLLHVTPELQVSEGALKVAFFDKEVVKIEPNEDPEAPKKIISKEIKLFIRIENKEDIYSIIERPATKLRLVNQFGDRYFKDEREIYKRAYAKYLEIKSKPVFDVESELDIARKRIAELEAKAAIQAETKEEPKKKGRPFVVKTESVE